MKPDDKQHSEWRIGTIRYIDQSHIQFRAVASDTSDRLFNGGLRHINGLNQYLFSYLTPSIKVVFKVISIEQNEIPYGQMDINKFVDEYTFSAIPLGEIKNKKYSPGIVDIPRVGSTIYACSDDDLHILFDSDEKLSLGTLAGYKTVYPSVQLDDIFSGNTSVLGNTGSGKSTTVRLLLSKIMNELCEDNTKIKPGAHFIIFDLHGDYKELFHSFQNRNTKIQYFPSDSFHLSPGELSIEDWASILSPSQRIQRPLLERTIQYSKLNNNGKDRLFAALAYEALDNTNTDSHAGRKILVSKYLKPIQDKVDKANKVISTEDTDKNESIANLLTRYNLEYGNLPKDITETMQHYLTVFLTSKFMDSNGPNFHNIIEAAEFASDENSITLNNISEALEMVFAEEEAKGNRQARSYSEGLITQLHNLREKYSNNLLSTEVGKSVTDILEGECNCCVFDVSNMPDSDGLKLFSNFIARLLFARNQQTNKPYEQPVYLIFDEAHRYIRETDLSDDSIFNRIAREGRKFGVHLMTISQIPSELSRIVLSQTSCFILHRIQNSVDLDYIKSNVPAISSDQVSRLPSFAPGTAAILGSAMKIPMEIQIDGLYKDATPRISMYEDKAETQTPKEQRTK